MSILIELPYLPPVSWMSLVWNTPALTLEACENFQKGSYRNRCHIAGPNGMQVLSIPLAKGKNQQTPIREVRIAYDEPWQKRHWRSICTAYGNAPYFEHYTDELAPFYEKNYNFLFDFNFELLEFILKKTGCKSQITLSEDFLSPGPSTPGDFRDAVSPKPEKTAAWFYPVKYAQVFMERYGFLPDLSALDLLFCCGKQSGNYFKTPNWSPARIADSLL